MHHFVPCPAKDLATGLVAEICYHNRVPTAVILYYGPQLQILAGGINQPDGEPGRLLAARPEAQRLDLRFVLGEVAGGGDPRPFGDSGKIGFHSRRPDPSAG